MKTTWYKTRWGAAAMAGFVGIGLGSGMAGNKTQVAAPVSYTTISVTPSPVVKTIMATVTETAVATETAIATATETIAVTETAKPASAPTAERQVKSTGDLGNANPQKSVYYSSCKEAKEAGAAPLYEGDPGYSSKLDRDGDGVACEK